MAPIPIEVSQTISPPIFYWGTPVVLITTENEDGTSNIAPMSSAWWLGNRCMLGLGAISQTTINLIRTKQCVLNLASDNMAGAVNALAKTTGSNAMLTAAEGIVDPSDNDDRDIHSADTSPLSLPTPISARGY